MRSVCAVSRDARVSFLFRSEADEKGKSDWHRWTSNRGFRPDGSWHHVAVSYQFGSPDSIRGYVDGKKIGGKWDMGGATARPPMVDDDDLWIGSSMGGSAGNSFTGAIDEVVIVREIIPATAFADRRIVITHPPKPPKQGVIPGVVSVTLHEDVGSEGAWPVQLPEPLVEYQQSAFGIARMPMAYGRGGVRRDWKGPVMLTAMAEIEMASDEVEWCLALVACHGCGSAKPLSPKLPRILATPADMVKSSDTNKMIHGFVRRAVATSRKSPSTKWMLAVRRL